MRRAAARLLFHQCEDGLMNRVKLSKKIKSEVQEVLL